MFIELSIFSVISTLLLFGFIFAGVARFGLLPSYSDYAPFWGKAVPINNMNLWSVVTLVSAFLLCPALLELGTASAFQFLGFLVPLHLIVVSLTPRWKTDRRQCIIHFISAGLCALGGLLWLTLVMDAWRLLAIVGTFVLTLALFSGSLRSSAVFWGEMMMFLSVFLTVLLAMV